MPVIRWDDEFEKWLDRRISLADKYRKKRLCLLTAIALGSPLEYEAFNPLYPFYLARGGNVSGGLDIYTTAEWANEKGFYPVSLVGNDNLHIDREKNREYEQDALRYQSGIVYIEGNYEKNIVKACRALCSVCFGSGRFFRSCRTDTNGVKVMANVGYGGHAQCFTGWREINVSAENSRGSVISAFYTTPSPPCQPRCIGWFRIFTLSRNTEQGVRTARLWRGSSTW